MQISKPPPLLQGRHWRPRGVSPSDALRSNGWQAHRAADLELHAWQLAAGAVGIRISMRTSLSHKHEGSSHYQALLMRCGGGREQTSWPRSREAGVGWHPHSAAFTAHCGIIHCGVLGMGGAYNASPQGGATGQLPAARRRIKSGRRASAQKAKRQQTSSFDKLPSADPAVAALQGEGADQGRGGCSTKVRA